MGAKGRDTHAEIFQQPEIWPDTVRRVRAAGLQPVTAPILTGAGTSAYAGIAIEAAWPGSRAVASTELFLDVRRFLAPEGAVVSLARSGDSPESIAVVEKVQRALPGVRHVAITCNAEGKLANRKGVEAILLDPRTNDRSLVMTSSYSNMVLAGITLARAEEAERVVPELCNTDPAALEQKARAWGERPPQRAVALASYPLFGAAREACLKMLEMTAGRVIALAETYLGLRHGPLSVVDADTVVLCFLSSDAERRRYEVDLVGELRAKNIGRLIALGAPATTERGLFHDVVETPAARLPDHFRTPAEIVFPQLLAYHFSLALGLDPDNPSPAGVINRVVQGVTIYD